MAALFLSVGFRASSPWKGTPEYTVSEERDKQLANIRKYVTQGSTSVRDYLINYQPDSAEIYDQEVRRAKASTTRAFLALTGWTSQQAAMNQIDRDLAEYWTVLDQNRPVSAQEKQNQGFELVHQRVMPARREVFTSVKFLEDQSAADKEAVITRFARRRDSDLTVIFIALSCTLAISVLLATGNQKLRRRFQRESRGKMEALTTARDSLEALSGRLLRIQEDERRKISRELHDGIGQTLTALRMEIHQVHMTSVGELNGGEERLLRARKLAEEAVRTVKDISLLLRPPLLDDLGLEPALTWLADQFNRRTEIRCRLHASNLPEQLADDIKTCVFRVVQEALHNCEKHASPTCVEVAIEQKNAAISICVEDDGSGFTLTEQNTPARHAGLGILGMRERAVLLGGTLQIQSSPGKGTKLHMTLPVAQIGSREVAMQLS